jgi:hypothetical protein
LATGAQRIGTFPQRTAGQFCPYGDLAFINAGLGEKDAALTLSERSERSLSAVVRDSFNARIRCYRATKENTDE